MATTTAETPVTVPRRIIAGTRIKWLRNIPDYLPANGWTLKYSLIKDATAPIDVTGSDNGDGRHLIDISIATSQDYEPGAYQFQEYVEDVTPTERYIIQRGLVDVSPLFTDEAQGHDWRSHVRITLDAIEALIQGKASKDQLSYSIAGRSVSRMTPAELIEWKTHYDMLWKREKKALAIERGKSAGNRVLTRFKA